MRNINRNLFKGLPASANALEEYDSDAAELVREAAQYLFKARRDSDEEALKEASDLTLQAAAELMGQAGGSVYVRFPIMVTARLVELEAVLLAVKTQAGSVKRPARINGLKTWPYDGTLPPQICRLCDADLNDATNQLASAICVVCGYWVCELCDGGTDPATGDAVCEDHKGHPLALNCTEYA
ncbi:hypothetical protein [Streptomyces sp. NPDC127084]|uniref:hypothetical protein n=1 Tax=Streptomyces sp. NPDC127084 TaxID=3347133 RepID=UPI003664F42B